VLTHVEPSAVPNSGRLIKKVDFERLAARGFATQQLATRETGSDHVRIYLAKVYPDAAGPALHFHEFDQLYFVLDGQMDVQIGLTTTQARKDCLVLLPAGVVHTNKNCGDTPEYHLALNASEPPPGAQLDYKIDIRYEPGKRYFADELTESSKDGR